MTQENLDREVKDSEILGILEDQKMAPSQVCEAYTTKYEFVGALKIRKKLREMAGSRKLEEKPMNDAQDLMYAVNNA